MRQKYNSFLFVSLLEGEQGWVQGRGEGVEDLGRGSFEGLLGAGGQVGDHRKTRQGAGRPSVVLGAERPTHFRHSIKSEMAIWQYLVDFQARRGFSGSQEVRMSPK